MIVYKFKILRKMFFYSTDFFSFKSKPLEKYLYRVI